MKPTASLQPGTDALFPLTTNVHWLQNYVECAIMEMPVQHGPDILTTAKLIPLTQCFLINRGTKNVWYLKSTSTGTKEAMFVISAPLMSSNPPRLPLFEQTDNVGKSDSFRSLKQSWESSRGCCNKPTAGMVGGRCRLLGWNSTNTHVQPKHTARHQF